MSNETAVVAAGTMILGLVLGGLITLILVNASWETDCQKIGVHVVNAKVYECRPKP